MAHDLVRWGRTEIPFTYGFGKIKDLVISVHPDLAVTVKAPEGTSIEAIREKIRKRGPWIRKAWREFELYLPKQPPRRYVNGETHRYLGRQYRLRAEKGDTDSVKCLRGYLRVTTKADPTPGKICDMLDDWYREHAQRVFRERLEACVKRAAMEGIAEPIVSIRKMKTRWGSCSKEGRISLNLELIKTPKDCIDYVIFHELCHVKERSHGPRFWKLLVKLVPDCEARRKKLNIFADV